MYNSIIHSDCKDILSEYSEDSVDLIFTSPPYADQRKKTYVGQNFWYLISENKFLYTDIVEPIGCRAKEHNKQFCKEKSAVINCFTKEFINSYCTPKGNIEWKKLVRYNSGNFDLDTFFATE